MGHRRKGIRFKHILLLAFLGMFAFCHSSALHFRMSPTKQAEQIKKKTDTEVRFGSYIYDSDWEIHYTETGDVNSEFAILFVHGTPGARDAYLDYLADPKLYKVARLITLDRPGFGYSEFGHAMRSLNDQAGVLYELIQKLPQKHTILVGHSFGGPVIAKAAMVYPTSVDGIVMVAPSICPELEPANWWRKPFDLPIIRLLVPASLRTSNAEIIPLKTELEKMKPEWQNITAEAVTVQGTMDRLVPKGNADFAQKMLTNSPYVQIDTLVGGDHFILWSERDLITDWILRLVNRIGMNGDAPLNN